MTLFSIELHNTQRFILAAGIEDAAWKGYALADQLGEQLIDVQPIDETNGCK